MAEEYIVANGTLEEKLDNVIRLQERVLVKLFGDVEGETKDGRIPRLEAKVHDHDSRISVIEKWAIRFGAVIGFIGGLIALAEAVARVASAIKH